MSMARCLSLACLIITLLTCLFWSQTTFAQDNDIGWLFPSGGEIPIGYSLAESGRGSTESFSQYQSRTYRNQRREVIIIDIMKVRESVSIPLAFGLEEENLIWTGYSMGPCYVCKLGDEAVIGTKFTSSTGSTAYLGRINSVVYTIYVIDYLTTLPAQSMGERIGSIEQVITRKVRTGQ